MPHRKESVQPNLQEEKRMDEKVGRLEEKEWRGCEKTIRKKMEKNEEEKRKKEIEV